MAVRSRVEGEEHANGPACALDPKLTHVAVAGACDTGGMWKPQIGTVFREQFDDRSYVLLLAFRKPGPPVAELVGVFDLPNHFIEYSNIWFQFRLVSGARRAIDTAVSFPTATETPP